MTYLVPFPRRFSHICPSDASIFLCQFRFGQQQSRGPPDHIYGSPSKPAKLNDTTLKKKRSLSIRRSNSLTANQWRAIEKRSWRTIWKTLKERKPKGFTKTCLFQICMSTYTTNFLNILVSLLWNWTSKFQLNPSYTLCIGIYFVYQNV